MKREGVVLGVEESFANGLLADADEGVLALGAAELEVLRRFVAGVVVAVLSLFGVLELKLNRLGAGAAAVVFSVTCVVVPNLGNKFGLGAVVSEAVALFCVLAPNPPKTLFWAGVDACAEAPNPPNMLVGAGVLVLF